jgi:YgiT-type zinc finger domain-containing protein
MMINRDMQVEKQVTYTLELNGKFFVIENVPARVDEETGEQFFSPSTVEHLQQIILTGQTPDRFTEVPVYKYAA